MSDPPTPASHRDRDAPFGETGFEPGEEQFLSTPGLDADFHGRSARGAAASLAAQACKFALYLVSTVVLARLLTPEDFGLYAFAFAIIGIAGLFKDLGFSYAAIQWPTIGHRQASTLFWINAGVGIGLALLTAAAAPLVGWIADTPGLTPLLVALAFLLPFAGLASQHQVLLVREVRFGALAVVEVTAVTLGVVTGVAAAVLGAGHWSLVAGYAVTEVVGAAGAWIACAWRPGLPSRGTGIRPLLSVGGYITGVRMLLYLSFAFDKLAIGSSAGERQLGLYDRAWAVLFLPINQFTTPLWHVAYTTLSRLQDDAVRYRGQLRRFVLASSALGMPSVALLVVIADTLIPLFLGSQWDDSVSLFRALAPIAFVTTLNAASGWLYLSLGRAKRQFVWTLGTTAATAAAVAIGLQWGAIGVAVAMSTSRVLLVLPTVVFTCAGTFVRWTDVVRPAVRPAFAALAAAALLAGAKEILPDMRAPIELVRDSVLYLLLYVGVLLALPDGPRMVRSHAATIVSLMRRTSTASTTDEHVETPRQANP